MVQISQPGKPYLETARTLVRAAQTITDSAIAGQLKALADDYERRAEKASHVDRPKHSPHWLLALNAKLEAFNVERVRGYIECSIGWQEEGGGDPRATPASAHGGQGHQDRPGKRRSPR